MTNSFGSVMTSALGCVSPLRSVHRQQAIGVDLIAEFPEQAVERPGDAVVLVGAEIARIEDVADGGEKRSDRLGRQF